MTRDETIRVLEKVCRLYIVQARRLSDRERSLMLDGWAEMFARDKYADVVAAVDSYVRSGKPFMPEAADIANVMAMTDTRSMPPGTDGKLFLTLMNTARIIANGEERHSIVDPGGYKWNEELQRSVYHHPEVRISRTSFTQYDFAMLPPEVQEYVEDIEGLRRIWPEIESNEVMARERFLMTLPEIRAELAERDDRNIESNRERLTAMFRKMADFRRARR